MSQTTNNNVSEEFIESLKGHFGLGILENLGRDKKDLQKMWPHASSWDIQDNVPLQFGKLPYPGKVSLELSIYWDVCPYLLDYVQSLKAKAEQEAVKAHKSSNSSLDPSAKQFIPPSKREESTGNETLIQPPEKKAKSSDKPNTRKVVEYEASTVITGY
ncbi:hypothetical protein RclHR1_01710002 [Rhizophagus clarus]|uniref:Uncharacterized protein n=1 Tax=Rhizophagus clarus TaxID=94130 RepID=A0A2Z6QNA1_9GLOM|nr:hypothetical protein RclHR1_01710002 [Rhizophagus clarus]GES82932.1 hypothetical protein RCL_jg27809.t1 [Rhizophagus clarus]